MWGENIKVETVVRVASQKHKGQPESPLNNNAGLVDSKVVVMYTTAQHVAKAEPVQNARMI